MASTAAPDEAFTEEEGSEQAKEEGTQRALDRGTAGAPDGLSTPGVEEDDAPDWDALSKVLAGEGDTGGRRQLPGGGDE